MKKLHNHKILLGVISILFLTIGAFISQITFAQKTNNGQCEIWEFHQALQDKNPNYKFCPNTGEVWMIEDDVMKLVTEKK